MTKEEIEMYYDLLGFKYEAAIGALYARDLVDDEWVRQSRKRFFDKLERERELHFRRVSDYEASIRLFFSMMDEKPGKYVSLTDIARKYSQDPPGYTIQSWMRSKNTIAYLRIWELINNYDFDDEACAALIESSKNASFNLTPSKWISRTKAGGIRVKRGKGGGVEAHEDIVIGYIGMCLLFFRRNRFCLTISLCMSNSRWKMFENMKRFLGEIGIVNYIV